MIEATDLTRRFGDVVAVDRLSLRVAEGTILALLGPNGAGKTTTVRMLAGLLAPISGAATVAGRDEALGGEASRVGLAPAQAGPIEGDDAVARGQSGLDPGPLGREAAAASVCYLATSLDACLLEVIEAARPQRLAAAARSGRDSPRLARAPQGVAGAQL